MRFDLQAATRPGSYAALYHMQKNQSDLRGGLEVAGFSMSHMSDTYGLLPSSRRLSVARLPRLEPSMPASHNCTINVLCCGGTRCDQGAAARPTPLHARPARRQGVGVRRMQPRPAARTVPLPAIARAVAANAPQRAAGQAGRRTTKIESAPQGLLVARRAPRRNNGGAAMRFGHC